MKTLKTSSLFLLVLVIYPACPAGADSPLGATRWQLAEFRSMSDEIGVLKPKAPGDVQITFGNDARVTMKLDCNRGTASWSADAPADGNSGALTFGPVASTRALCPGANLGEHLAKNLEWVRGYLIRDGRLSLSLMADGGIYLFDPTPPIASKEDSGARVFQVARAPSGLNVRFQASTASAVMAHFRNGDLLDNLGCKQGEDRQWCDVQRFGGGTRGYVAAEFLEPATAPNGEMPAGEDDSALRAGQDDFDATGEIGCTLGGESLRCDFAVARGTGGYATVIVNERSGWPRAIFFALGRAIGASMSQANAFENFAAERRADAVVVTIDDEQYEIPDAVIFGG